MTLRVLWDLPDDPSGNLVHIAAHDLTPEEVEEALDDPKSDTSISRSSGLPITFGRTSAGRFVAVVWELIDDAPTIRPITAYEVPPRKRRKRGKR